MRFFPGRMPIIGLLAALAAPAWADIPERTTNLVVYGDDPCPQPEGEEIVVCARQPESDRYRIPKRLREGRKDRPAETSWVSRVEALEDATRFTRPNSCSTVGSGGQTGCFETLLRQWRAERRARPF